MLAHFVWEDNVPCLGVLQSTIEQTPAIETKHHEIETETDIALKFPLLLRLFGAWGFVRGKQNHQYRLELQEKLWRKQPFSFLIWYPLTFQDPEITFETVTIQYKDDHITFASDDGSIITMHPLRLTYQDMGYQVFDVSDEILSKKSFHQLVLDAIATQKPDRVVNQREIYYLPELLQCEITNIEEKFQFDLDDSNSHFVLFQAFCVVVRHSVPEQVVHRDSWYNSVSVMFYLDEPTEPGTVFYPLTHTLPMGVKDGFSFSIKPHLKLGEAVMIHGRLLHGGLSYDGPDLTDRPRVLYVFQFRPANETRQQRSKYTHEYKEIADNNKELYSTVFQVK